MNRALLLGLAMSLLGVVVWFFAAGPGAQGKVDGGAPARVARLGPATGVPARTVVAPPTGARSPVRLEPVPTARAVPDDGADSNGAAPPTPPPAGTVRVLGQVRVEDDPILGVDATVRVYAGEPEEARSRALGVVAVRAGTFHIDVALDVLMGAGRRGAADGLLTFVLIAPGFEGTVAHANLSDAVDGVLHVQLETSRCQLLVVGRVVTAEGVPVPVAEVVVADFGPIGRGVELRELQTASDGCFQLALGRCGFVDVVAHHVSRGVVRIAARAEAGSTLLDLGDLRLEPRGVVSGRLVGYSRVPLGRHQIELQPVSEEGDYAGHEVLTDDQGRFHFACLDAIAYRVWIDGLDNQSEEVLPVVTPDTHDLELRVPVPSARVTVVSEDGRPVADIGLTVRTLQRVGDAWRIGRSGASDVMESESQPGVFQVTFGRPGVYSIGATHTVDGRRATAHERLEIGMEHRVVHLELAPEARRSLVLEVTDPAGAPIPDWNVSFVDPATGITGGSRGARSPEVALAPGTWSASVVPRGATYVMPFQVEVEVTAEMDRLTLRAPELGGRLTVRASWSGSNRSSVVGKLTRTAGGPSLDLLLADGEDVTTQQPLPAGDYELTVRGAHRNESGDFSTIVNNRRPMVTRSVSIRAGETTWLQLSLP